MHKSTLQTRTNKRHAFTIVELVIVIAVIAILAATLIPTFSSIIKKAYVSNDTTVAASITKELIIQLGGDKIEDEATLIELINDIDPDGTKLSPSSARYGYHYWYDMNEQTIMVATAEEIANKPSVNASSANTSFRDIYGVGCYLIDSNNSSDIAKLLNDIDSLSDETSYKTLVEDLGKAAKKGNDKELAESVLNRVSNTTIRTEKGIFHYAGATNNYEYFASGAEVLVSTRYVYDDGEVSKAVDGVVPTPVNNDVTLPSSVLLVKENALDYGDGNGVVIKTTFSSPEDIASVFGPVSTDAKITDAEEKNTYIVTKGPSGGVDGAPETDVLHIYYAENVTEWTTNIVLKLPFEDFTIGYDVIGNTGNLDEEALAYWNQDTLYVSPITGLDLFAKDEDGNSSEAVKEWKSSNEKVATVDNNGTITIVNPGVENGYTATITATAINLYGAEKTHEIVIAIDMPLTANVKVGNRTLNLDGGKYEIDWFYFDGADLAPAILGNISYKYGFAKGNDNITVSIENDSIFNLSENKMSLKDQAGDTTFKISVNGCLETEFKVNIIDNSKSPVEVNFHDKTNNDTYLYYIGDNNEIKLGNLFGTKLDGYNLTGATLNIYDNLDADGNLHLYNTNWTTDEVSATFAGVSDYDANKNYNPWKLTSDWKNQEIKFNITDGYDPEDFDIYIKITPEDGVAIFVKVVVVDGKNVTDVDSLRSPSTNVVLHRDLTVTTGTTLNIGGKTLYGNGYVISAQKYKSSAGDTELNDCLIYLNDGTIDNIYIDGPVYPTLDYANNANKYHVSGVLATGNSTIKNSYICGFRQPVKANGTILSIENTTLRGGNYANLLLAQGNLNLKDVTTIQDQDGMDNTFEYKENDKLVSVTGMGIAIESGAFNSTIDINGYLDQYNWVKKGQSAKMPQISANGVDLDTGKLFDCIFNGVEKEVGRWPFQYVIEADMGRLKYFINQDDDQDPTSRTDGYVHAGIIIAEIGDTGDMDKLTVKVTIDDTDRTDGKMVKRELAELNLRFNKEGLESLFTAKDYLGTDGIFIAWSYKDGREWTADSIKPGVEKTTRYVNPTEGTVANYVLSNSKALEDNSGCTIIYRGYYDDFGAYAEQYKVNASNKVVK